MQFQPPPSMNQLGTRQSNFLVSGPMQGNGIQSNGMYPQQQPRFSPNSNIISRQVPLLTGTQMGYPGMGSPIPLSNYQNFQNPSVMQNQSIPLGFNSGPMPVRGSINGFSQPLFVGSPIRSLKDQQNWSYDTSMRPSTDLNTQIIPQKVFCVICNKSYAVTQRQSHKNLHKKPPTQERIKIRKLPEYSTQNNDPKVRPIVEPQQYNIQYNPNQYILEKIVKYTTPVIKPEPLPMPVQAPRTSTIIPPNNSQPTIQAPSNPVPIPQNQPRQQSIPPQVPVPPVSPVNQVSVPSIRRTDSISTTGQQVPINTQPNYRPETVRLTNQNQTMQIINPQMLQGGRTFKQQNPQQRNSGVFGQNIPPDRRQQRDTFLSDRPASIIQPSNNLFGRQTIQSHQFAGSQISNQPRMVRATNNQNAMPVISQQPYFSRTSSQNNDPLVRQQSTTNQQPLRNTNTNTNININNPPVDLNMVRKNTFGNQSNVSQASSAINNPVVQPPPINLQQSQANRPVDGPPMHLQQSRASSAANNPAVQPPLINLQQSQASSSGNRPPQASPINLQQSRQLYQSNASNQGPVRLSSQNQPLNTSNASVNQGASQGIDTTIYNPSMTGQRTTLSQPPRANSINSNQPLLPTAQTTYISPPPVNINTNASNSLANSQARQMSQDLRNTNTEPLKDSNQIHLPENNSPTFNIGPLSQPIQSNPQPVILSHQNSIRQQSQQINSPIQGVTSIIQQPQNPPQLRLSSQKPSLSDQKRDISYYNPSEENIQAQFGYGKSPDDKVIPRQFRNQAASLSQPPRPNSINTNTANQPLAQTTSISPPPVTVNTNTSLANNVNREPSQNLNNTNIQPLRDSNQINLLNNNNSPSFSMGPVGTQSNPQPVVLSHQNSIRQQSQGQPQNASIQGFTNPIQQPRNPSEQNLVRLSSQNQPLNSSIQGLSNNVPESYNQNPVRLSSLNQPLNVPTQANNSQKIDTSYYNPPSDSHNSSSNYARSPDDKIIPRQLRQTSSLNSNAPKETTPIKNTNVDNNEYFPLKNVSLSNNLNTTQPNRNTIINKLNDNPPVNQIQRSPSITNNQPIRSDSVIYGTPNQNTVIPNAVSIVEPTNLQTNNISPINNSNSISPPPISNNLNPVNTINLNPPANLPNNSSSVNNAININPPPNFSNNSNSINNTISINPPPNLSNNLNLANNSNSVNAPSLARNSSLQQDIPIENIINQKQLNPSPSPSQTPIKPPQTLQMNSPNLHPETSITQPYEIKIEPLPILQPVSVTGASSNLGGVPKKKKLPKSVGGW